jgi:hypothetical protein
MNRRSHRLWLGIIVAAALLPAQESEMLDMARRLSAKFQPGKAVSVAVLGFAGPDADSAQLSNMLVNKLNVLLAGQGKDLRVVNHTQVEGALRETGIKPSGDMTPASIDTIAKRLGVTAVVSGSFTLFNDHVSVDAAVFEAPSGNLIGGHSIRLPRTPDINAMLGKSGKINAVAAPVVLPSGKVITVRLSDTLAAEKLKSGDAFRATLDSPLIVNGVTLLPRGAEVVGRINSAEGKSDMALSLHSILTKDGQSVYVRTTPLRLTSRRGSGSSAPRVLGSAIGSGVGGRVSTIGSSTGSVVTVAGGSGGKLVLESESILEFRLAEPASLPQPPN